MGTRDGYVGRGSATVQPDAASGRKRAETQRAERGLRRHEHGHRAQARPAAAWSSSETQQQLEQTRGALGKRQTPRVALLRESPPWASGFVVAAARSGLLRLEWAGDTGPDRRGRNSAASLKSPNHQDVQSAQGFYRVLTTHGTNVCHLERIQTTQPTRCPR